MALLEARVTSAGGEARLRFDVAIRQPPSPSDRFMMGFSAAEIQSLPDPRTAASGTPAANVLRAANQDFTRELDLSSGGINQMCGSWAFAAALMYVYLMDKDSSVSAWYRHRVEEYLLKWEHWSGGTKYSNYARKLNGAVMCADLIGHRPSSFMDWLDRVRYMFLGGHSRWPDLYTTAYDCPANHGTNARASFLAASLYIEDTNAMAEAIAMKKAWCGDLSDYSTWPQGKSGVPGGFGPIGHDDAASWCEHGTISNTAPNSWRPVNAVVGDPTRDGGQPMELYRENTGYSLDADGAPIWGSKGGMYQGTALVGALAGHVIAEAAGYPSWEWGDKAVLRSRLYMHRWGPANVSRSSDPLGYGGTGVSHENPFGWIDPLLNAKYTDMEREGIVFPSRAQEGYGYSFTDWLYG